MADDFEDFVRRVKEATHIEDVIDQEGADYRLAHKRGNYLRGEVHDSLVVRVDEQYYVWNDRSEKGDVFSWLEARRKWDFYQCLEWLAERAHIEMPKRFQAKEDQPHRLSARMREDVFSIAGRVMAKWLWEDEEALSYARGRGWSDETIREAGLGFSGRNTAAAVSEMGGEFAMHGVEREHPLAVAIMGIRNEGSGIREWGRRHEIEVQQNWIEWGLIPGMMGKTRLVYVHWEAGRARYLTGRNILGAEINKEDRVIKSFNLPVTLAGGRRLFFNHKYGRREDECILVEGQADAVTLGQWGFAAAAIAGTSWEDHTEALGELRKRHARLYLGLDADDAGTTALMGKDKSWPLWETLGAMTRVVRWG